MNQTVDIVSTGLCSAEGCPPPTRIECISVEKVYDSCYERESLPSLLACIAVDSDAFTPGLAIQSNCENGVISCVEIEKRPIGNGLSEIDLLFNIDNIIIYNPFNTQETLPIMVTPFIKTLTLCCPEGASVDCSHSTITRCICIVNSIMPAQCWPGFQVIIACQIQVCLVVKCISRVQLLVPSYGFCVPAPCTALPGICPSSPPAQCF